MKFISFNAGLLSIPILGGLRKVEPAGWVEERFSKMTEVLANQDTDVLLLQEVYSQSHKNGLAAALAEYFPYSAFSRIDPVFRLLPDSLMILSKYPISDAHFVRFDAGRWDERLLDTKGFLRVDIPDCPLGHLRICNAHTTAGVFTHPEHPKIDAVRMRQIEQLATCARKVNGTPKIILAGDFNCGPGVPSGVGSEIVPVNFGNVVVSGGDRVSRANYQKLIELGFTDTYASIGLAEEATWSPTDNPLNVGGDHASWGCPAQRIDHVWVEAGHLKATEGAIFLTEPIVSVSNGMSVPLSDHYGYWVNLSIA